MSTYTQENKKPACRRSRPKSLQKEKKIKRKMLMQAVGVEGGGPPELGEALKAKPLREARQRRRRPSSVISRGSR